MENAIKFLNELKQNNNREWFTENKKRYEVAKKEFESFISLLIDEIAKFDSQLTGVSAKQCIFRLYRDVRFSKDKRPYKEHFGAFMGGNGRKTTLAAYYIHIDPTGCFLGGGLYRPEPQILKKVRQQIDYDASSLRDIINHKNFKETYGELEGEQLKTAPKDFPKDHPDIDLLRFKDFIGTHSFPYSRAMENNFVEYAARKLAKLKPLNDYLNSAIQFEGEETNIQF
eukprot:Anaeramoba_ignava/a479909_7.p1 GENE.a479909_7~~a479909_7.p1  ORF type:complete len:227 (-),score=19.01 a479909_7:79-759(-)